MLAVTLSCGTNSRSLFGGDLVAEVKVDPGANQNSAVALELVIVYDKKLLEQFLAYPARTWFEKREQLRRDDPGQKQFVSWEWEWVPGQEVKPQEISFGTGARGGIVFANYFTPGDHRARIDPHSNLVIHLGEKGFSVEPSP